ncbi:27866_t:CDS:1, partial [Racocetra persica]
VVVGTAVRFSSWCYYWYCVRFSSWCVVSHVSPVSSLVYFFSGGFVRFFGGSLAYFFGGLACFFSG